MARTRQQTAADRRQRDDAAKQRIEANKEAGVKKRKKTKQEQAEAKLRKEFEKRWNEGETRALRVMRVGTTKKFFTFTAEDEENANTDKDIAQRKLDKGKVLNAGAYADTNENVHYVAQRSGHKTYSTLISANDINFDTANPMTPLQIVAKAKERFTDVNMFRKMEYAGFFSPIEGALIKTFDECRHAAAQWGVYKEERRASEFVTEYTEEVKAHIECGLDVWQRWEEKYHEEHACSREVVTFGATWLVKNWDDLPAWFTDAPDLYKKVDEFLSKYHEETVRFYGPGRLLHRISLESLAKGPSIVFDKGDWQSDDHDPVIKNQKELKALQYCSMIAKAAFVPVTAPQNKMGRPRKNPGQLLEAPMEALRKNEHYDEWVNYFWPPGQAAPNLQRNAIPRALLAAVRTAYAEKKADRDMRRILKAAADDLSDVRHWRLVQVVWSDIVIPTAIAGDREKVEQVLEELAVMASGKQPKDIGTGGQFDGLEEEDDEVDPAASDADGDPVDDEDGMLI